VENFLGNSYSAGKRFNKQDEPGRTAFGVARVADDYMEQCIDLNEQLIRNRPATFFLRVGGISMINAGIYDGDIVIVDRSIKPQNGKIVIAAIDGEMPIRRYEKTINRLRLIPKTPKLSASDVSEFMDFIMWGVVICVIRNVSVAKWVKSLTAIVRTL
jgi:DNA polymerase V